MKKLLYHPAGALLLALAILFSSFVLEKQKPTLYLIGDSTVKNGKGRGDGGLWGWGSYLANYMDTTKINVENDALGGTSSRTFQTTGLWDKVLVKIKPGDYVIMQFGHNDSSPLDDTARARGTIRGVGDEQKDIFNPIRKVQETVHTYGWYMRKFVTDAKEKGATVIIVSPIPRNSWKDGKVNRNNVDSYGAWSKQVAGQAGAYFVDLNGLVADKYDADGEDKVKSTYFGPKDATHTIEAGAILNAQMVATGIKDLKKCDLRKYVNKKSL